MTKKDKIKFAAEIIIASIDAAGGVASEDLFHALKPYGFDRVRYDALIDLLRMAGRVRLEGRYLYADD